MENKVCGFKGFNKGLVCNGGRRPKKYKENTTYSLRPASLGQEFLKLCYRGFHFCKHPLSVFHYYAPSTSEFARVEAKGEVESGLYKSCTNKIKILSKISVYELITESLRYLRRCYRDNFKEAGGDGVLDIAENPFSARITSAVRGIAAVKATDSVAECCGSAIAAATGYASAALADGSNAIAATISDRSVAMDTCSGSISCSTGDYSLVSSHELAAAAGFNSVADAATPGAIAVSSRGQAKGVVGSWLVLRDLACFSRFEHGYKAVKLFYVDGKKVKADTLYRLYKGELKEV